MSAEIAGLREAVVAEAQERTTRDNVELRLEAAYHALTTATAARHEARARASTGETVKLTSIENTLRSANDEVTLLSEALDLANARLAEASADVNMILRQENERLVAVAQANFDQAQSEFMTAIKARAAAGEAFAAAKRGAAMTADTARRFYAAEIAAVG